MSGNGGVRKRKVDDGRTKQSEALALLALVGIRASDIDDQVWKRQVAGVMYRLGTPGGDTKMSLLGFFTQFIATQDSYFSILTEDTIKTFVGILVGGMYIDRISPDGSLCGPSVGPIGGVPYLPGEFRLYEPYPLDDKGKQDPERYIPSLERCPKCYEPKPLDVIENPGVLKAGASSSRYLFCRDCITQRLMRRVLFTRNEMLQANVVSALYLVHGVRPSTLDVGCWECCGERLVMDGHSVARNCSNIKLKDRPFCANCSGKYRLESAQCSMCYVATPNVTPINKRGVRYCADCIAALIESAAESGIASKLEKTRPLLRRECEKHKVQHVSGCPVCGHLERQAATTKRKQERHAKQAAAQAEREKKKREDPKRSSAAEKRRAAAAAKRAQEQTLRLDGDDESSEPYEDSEPDDDDEESLEKFGDEEEEEDADL